MTSELGSPEAQEPAVHGSKLDGPRGAGANSPASAAKCSRCGLTNCSCVGGYGGPLRPTPPAAAKPPKWEPSDCEHHVSLIAGVCTKCGAHHPQLGPVLRLHSQPL